MSSPAASHGPAPAGAGRAAVHGETGSLRESVHGASPVRIGAGGTDQAQVDADNNLMLRLSVEGFGGAAWQQLVEHVYDYARRTLHQLMRDGMLVHRIPLLLPRDRQAPQTVRAFLSATEVDHRELRDEVVDDALASTLSYWRRKVIPQGRWNPTEGAQLRTYFVNVAVMRLVKAMGPHVRRLGATSRHEVGSAIERAMQIHGLFCSIRG